MGVLAHTLLAEYLPFIVLQTALFTVAGGICVRGNLHGSPGLNVALMAIGAVLASVMGTTGASMLMIRPLIRANDNRKLMVKAIAEDRGIRMPSFFGYMAWSCAILLPLFALMTVIWFR